MRFYWFSNVTKRFENIPEFKNFGSKEEIEKKIQEKTELEKFKEDEVGEICRTFERLLIQHFPSSCPVLFHTCHLGQLSLC
jgi:hypothetical protein